MRSRGVKSHSALGDLYVLWHVCSMYSILKGKPGSKAGQKGEALDKKKSWMSFYLAQYI